VKDANFNQFFNENKHEMCIIGKDVKVQDNLPVKPVKAVHSFVNFGNGKN
jgi:hypothetical protein